MTNSAQADVKEFMWSFLGGQTYSKQVASSGALAMQFKHPLTRIKFMLAASHPNIIINSITFKSLKTNGTCTISLSPETTTWSSLDGNADLVMSFASGLAFNDNPSSPTSIGPDLIVIPQIWNGEIEVNASWNDWGDTPVAHTVTATIPAITWEAGKSYTYTFSISTDDLVVNITNFTEQW